MAGETLETDALAATARSDGEHRRRAAAVAALLRLEDWLLGAFVVALAVTTGRAVGAGVGGPFDGGDPVAGAFRLAAVLGAVACLAARRPDDAPAGAGASVTSGAAAGPLVGGLLLVGVSGGSALGLTDSAVLPYCLVALAVAVAVRFAAPPPSATVRRALVTPFVLAAGGIFWTVVRTVFATPLLPAGRAGAAAVGGLLASPAFGFLVAFSAVYYAMLVYAPRQVAGREGGPLAWLARYALFLAAIVLGIGWLAAFAS